MLIRNVEIGLKPVQWVGVNGNRLARNGDQCRTGASMVAILTFFPGQKISCLGR